MTNAPVKLGFVGLSASGGWASKSHILHLRNSPHYQIVALLNRSKESAEKSAKEYGFSSAASYGNIQDFVADPNIDMVAVSVKVPDHSANLMPVLKAGKDVFVEWPLGRNLEEAKEFVALAKANNVKTIVGLQARQNPAIRKVKDMIAAGELGDILGTTMNGTGYIFGPSTSQTYAYCSVIESGANTITIAAGHAMDAMCFVLGEMKDLQATLANNRPRMPITDDSTGEVVETVDKSAHDWMSVSGRLLRGGIATVVYQGGTSSTGKDFYWEINGTKGSLVLEADAGLVQMYQPRIRFVGAEAGAKLETVEVEQAEDFSYNVGKAWDAYLGQGDGTLTTFEDALVRHKMIDAIYRSDKNGLRESYL